jgi:hypothetical protein
MKWLAIAGASAIAAARSYHLVFAPELTEAESLWILWPWHLAGASAILIYLLARK